MKNIKQLLILLGVLAFVGGQLYYGFMIHPTKVSEFEATSLAVETKEKQLDTLIRQLANIEGAKKEMISKTLEVEGIRGKLPPYNTPAIHLLDLSRMMVSTDFQDVTVTSHDPTTQMIGEESLVGVAYTLKYIAPYEKSKHFVENLRGAYQFITITKLSMSNTPQNDKEKMMLLDEYTKKQLVETTLEITLFFDDVVTKDEFYHPTLNMVKNPGGAFESIKEPAQLDSEEDDLSEVAAEIEDSHQVRDETEQIDEITKTDKEKIKREELPKYNQDFSLDIYDILRSGDTYRFQGPGGEGSMGDYKGLVSAEDVYITLDVERNGYSIVLDDSEGNREEGKIETKIKTPQFVITSEAKQIQDKMPQVHITVKNTTGVTMPITIQGTLLENIHVYNSSGAKLSPGETSGNISLS